VQLPDVRSLRFLSLYSSREVGVGPVLTQPRDNALMGL